MWLGVGVDSESFSAHASVREDGPLRTYGLRTCGDSTAWVKILGIPFLMGLGAWVREGP